MAKEVEKKSQKEKKEKKHFFKDFKAELKKVIWPTPKQVVNNTIAVVTIVLITAVIVFALDLIFETLNTYGIDNIRNLVKKENITNTYEIENSSEDTSVTENNITEENTNTNSVENNVVQE